MVMTIPQCLLSRVQVRIPCGEGVFVQETRWWGGGAYGGDPGENDGSDGG